MSTVFWVGDSTVAFNYAKTFPQTGIGQVFSLYCSHETTIVDCAKNGESSKSHWEKQYFTKDLDKLSNGDFLYIEFGHNDEKEAPDRFTDPATSYPAYLMKYVSLARSKGAFPVLITPLSRRHFTEDGKIMDTHTTYPAAVLSLAEKEKIPCIDLCRLSKELLESTGEENSRKWFMFFPADTYENYPLGSADNTHLHVQGAVVMAGLVAKAIKDLGSPYADILNQEQESI